jgi:hypothetical protein
MPTPAAAPNGPLDERDRAAASSATGLPLRGKAAASSADKAAATDAGASTAPPTTRKADREATAKSLKTGQPASGQPASGRPDQDSARPDTARPQDRPDELRAGGARSDKNPIGKSPASPTTQSGKPSVPNARLSSYAEEAAELLAGLTSSRRRRKTDIGASTPDPASADPADRAASTRQTKQPAD